MRRSYESRPARWLALILVSFCIGGCISPTFYVDRTLGDVPASKLKKVATPHPVQLIFEFDTKGSPNAKATTLLHDRVVFAIDQTHDFSSVGNTPVASGAVLSIKINNVSLTNNAAAKGFVTGLTLGLAGNAVTDGYVCNVDYLPGTGTARISKEVHHAMVTTVGASGAPPNSDRMPSVNDAIFRITDQLIAHGLNDLVSDPAFK